MALFIIKKPISVMGSNNPMSQTKCRVSLITR